MRKLFYYLDLFVATTNKNIAVIGISLGVLLVFVNSIIRFSIDFSKFLFIKTLGLTSVGNFLVTHLTSINSSMTWAGELTNYLFIFSALFGAAYGFKKGIHISVTVLLNLFPAKLAKYIFVVANFISFGYLSISAYFGYRVVAEIYDMELMTDDLGIGMWIPNLVLPLAFGGAAFRAGEKVIEIAQTNADEVLIRNEEEVVHDSVIKD